MNKICNKPLLENGKTIAKCHRRKGHEGQHEQPQWNGNILKWDD